MEVQPGLYDFRIVEHHKFPLRKVRRQGREDIFAHFAVTVDQQFGAVAFRQREFGDTAVRQVVIEVLYLDLFGFFYHV